jgi:long-chain acyl-CoA synthetase
MYPGLQAAIRPNQPAIVMAQSGETITYAELEQRSNRRLIFCGRTG